MFSIILYFSYDMKCCILNKVQRTDVVCGECVTSIQKADFHQEVRRDEGRIEVFHELNGGGGGASGGKNVVEDEHALVRFHGVGVDFDGGLAVLQLVGSLVSGVGELSRFPDGNERHMECECKCGGEEISPGFQPYHHIGLHLLGHLQKHIEHLLKIVGIVHDCGDVQKLYSFFWKIGYDANLTCIKHNFQLSNQGAKLHFYFDIPLLFFYKNERFCSLFSAQKQNVFSSCEFLVAQ